MYQYLGLEVYFFRIFACKLSDDFSGFVDACRTGKRNRAGALIFGNGRISLISNLNKWIHPPMIEKMFIAAHLPHDSITDCAVQIYSKQAVH